MMNQVASVTVCVTSNFPDATHIRVKPQKGTFFLYGLGFTDQQRDVYANTGLHSDCITGNPQSLSDERIKDHVVKLESSNCLSFCNSLSPSMYLRTDTDEIRSGLIAQSVKASLEQHSIPTNPVIGSKIASIDPGDLETQPSAPEELMTLSYDRLVPMLLGAVKELTSQVDDLKSLLQTK